MERREFLSGVATVTASTAMAQSGVTFGQPANEPTSDELEAAYKVCRERGHVATAWGNGHATYTNAIFTVIPDRPATGYKERSETPWETCFYCKKQFRFVTTQEEKV